ncbi:MAG: SH3 domain-containing protein [Firmicutes bacterium]|nr:SH3 domain-containing protein [Bacillota bacterium]
MLVATEYQLYPPKENTFDAEFSTVFQKFTDAVYKKDLVVLDAFLNENITFSFGEPAGKKGFYEFWNLDNRPEQSELWAVLEKILRLGGAYNSEARSYYAPYTYINFPNEFDPYENFAIIEKDVKICEKKDADSTVIGYLSYNIVQFIYDSEFWSLSDKDFVRIRIPSGLEGYIQKKFIISPIEYRLCISCNDNGEWKLNFLFAGD